MPEGHNLGSAIADVRQSLTKKRGKCGPYFDAYMQELMARFIIENRLKTVEDLQGFKSERYKYRKTGSTGDSPLFVRKG